MLICFSLTAEENIFQDMNDWSTRKIFERLPQMIKDREMFLIKNIESPEKRNIARVELRLLSYLDVGKNFENCYSNYIYFLSDYGIPLNANIESYLDSMQISFLNLYKKICKNKIMP